MNEQLIKELLKEYAVAVDNDRALKAEHAKERAALIPPDLAQDLEDLDAEFDSMFTAAIEAIEAKKAAVVAAILEFGKTVKSPEVGFQALFIQPAAKVDAKEFAGYILNHPEAKVLLKEQAPSVQVRKMEAK